MDEADLATVMEWDFEWEVLVEEGVEGEGCDHTETGWSKAIRDLISFFPSSSMEGVWAEPTRRRRTYVGERRRGQHGVNTGQLFNSTHTSSQPDSVAFSFPRIHNPNPRQVWADWQRERELRRKRKREKDGSREKGETQCQHMVTFSLSVHRTSAKRIPSP